MTDIWVHLTETFAQAIRSKRIGTPVFARISAHLAGNSDEVTALLQSALGAARDWLGDEPIRVTALGSLKAGQVSVLAEFLRGQTALVSAGERGEASPSLEAMLIGTRGVVSWTPDSARGGANRISLGQPSDASNLMLDAVRQSLASSRPVCFEDGRLTSHDPSSMDVLDESHRQVLSRKQLKPTAPPFGVLLVSGAHSHQENYAEAFAAESRCRLVGVTDEASVPRSRQRLNESFARKLKIPLLPDLDQALQRRDVHIVSVVADPERRARVALRCAVAGKHLYLDKPMAASVEQAEEIVRAIEDAGVVSQMFSQVRSPLANRVRRIIQSRSLGELRAIHLDLTFAKGPAGTVRIDRPRRESATPRRFETADSKRELFNVGVYPLALLEWLLSRPVRRVRCSTGNYFFAEHQRNDMEDFAALLLELDGKLIVSLAVGRTGWRSHPMGGLNHACLVGTRGATTVDAYRPRCDVWADELPWLPPRIDPEDPMGFWKSTMEKARTKNAWITPSYADPSDVAHFLDCIQQGTRSDVSAQVGADVVRTLMAAYRSAATGQFVPLSMSALPTNVGRPTEARTHGHSHPN